MGRAGGRGNGGCRPFKSTAGNSSPRIFRTMGMSFRTSCSCKLIVCVEITPLRPVSSANFAAGTRYASDLPTPVPASATSGLPADETLRHRHRQQLLLPPVFEILGDRERSIRGKYFTNPLRQIRSPAVLRNRNHPRPIIISPACSLQRAYSHSMGRGRHIGLNPNTKL